MTVHDWLGKDNKLGIDIISNKYMHNESFDEFINRISNNNSELKKEILEKKYLHGGRTLSNYNTNNGASTSNCYSSGYCPDDTNGILELNKNLGLTYKAQGGQGLSLSKVRPKGCKISKGGYETDGIIPFMQMFDTTTASISQGGSRKGALMMSIDCWHKEVKDFITIKTDTNLINKANLSVEIDDFFMEAVKEYYDTGEEIEQDVVFHYDGGSIDYKVKPIEIYKLICNTAHEYAEPGIIYTNKFRNYNLMELDDEYEIVTGNPCGEQPLPKNGACNLGSINLSEFVKEPYTEFAHFDYSEFKNTVKIAIRALDEVLDYGADLHALPEQREMAKNYRNIGLGIMGLGSMFFKLGIKYGSNESILLTDEIGSFMFRTAVKTSVELAREKGTFPKYKDIIFDSEIMKYHFTSAEIKEMKKYGIRNCSLLSIAPSGSIGTLLNITTGCEPAFRISYKRKTESLHKDKEVYYDVLIKEAQEYKELYPNNELPDYFVSSENIHWMNRIRIQAALQRHIDTAISSTVNLPNEATVTDVEQLYLHAWESGLKGVTIFRDGCKRIGILTTGKKKEDVKECEENNVVEHELARGVVIQASDDVVGKKRKLTTGCGSLHCTAFFDPINGQLMETYLSKGSTGGCNNFMIGLSRMISLAARAGCSIETIIDQLNSCGSCPSYAVRTATKHDTSKGSCCPIAIGNALKDMYKEMMSEITCEEDEEEYEESDIKTEVVEKTNEKIVNPCPKCGDELMFEGGCNFCKSCGYSKCE